MQRIIYFNFVFFLEKRHCVENADMENADTHTPTWKYECTTRTWKTLTPYNLGIQKVL